MEYVAGSIALDSNVSAREIGAILKDRLKDFDGQIGYRQPSVGTRNKAEIPSFIIISPNFGVVIIDVIDDKITSIDESLEFFKTSEGRDVRSRDVICDEFEQEVQNRLKKDGRLYNRARKELYIRTNKIILFCRNTRDEVNDLNSGGAVLSDTLSKEEIREGLFSYLKGLYDPTGVPSDLIDVAISMLEGTSAYDKARKAGPIIDPETKNDFIRISLSNTFKLDQTQRRISMQIPDGPQRIRGLAGTGKTVILSLKAALAHKDFPDFKILFLFNTQSMYPQIRSLISEYYVSETKQTVDWGNLHVYHAWGGKSQAGLYSSICEEYGLKPLTFSDVKGSSDALGSIYSSLLRTHSSVIKPYYDLVLIDEAQDFSSPVFEAAFRLCKDPKRLVWAYDEFQSMTDIRMPAPEELFGKNADGQPNMPNSVLDGSYPGDIEKDFILPNSYRNPRITLLSAHSLALGLCRQDGAIDMIESRRDWEALGYKVLQPAEKSSYESGDPMVIERPLENSRNILENLMRDHHRNEKELMQFQVFDSRADEIDFVAKEVCSLVRDENVAPEEIIVVTLDIANSKSDFTKIRSILNAEHIRCIMPGFIEKPSAFKEKGAVTLTTPFRAKGNEANIVFVIGAEAVPRDATFRSRNALFVGITRSRGWTYVSGVGDRANEMRHEFECIFNDYPHLKFSYPSPEDLKRRRIILSRDDAEIQKKQAVLEEVIATDKELLIEMLRSNPELLQQIVKETESKK
ncbi:DEAD/DEAH box helicase [Azospirillum argentinense]|uniref:DEAD/DEAH box helicase n=1 Tax=Azospirillum argentinense TaxID=2970906 RepID=UPI0009DE75FA|nr:ATP-binding domain-containing protein [Azospirillum argentinense]